MVCYGGRKAILGEWKGFCERIEIGNCKVCYWKSLWDMEVIIKFMYLRTKSPEEYNVILCFPHSKIAKSLKFILLYTWFKNHFWKMQSKTRLIKSFTYIKNMLSSCSVAGMELIKTLALPSKGPGLMGKENKWTDPCIIMWVVRNWSSTLKKVGT